jgi:hypothetical protein
MINILWIAYFNVLDFRSTSTPRSPKFRSLLEAVIYGLSRDLHGLVDPVILSKDVRSLAGQ